MIGRGVLYDPLLPLRIRTDNNEPQSSYLTQTAHFIYALLDAINSGDVRDVSKMRKTKEYWCLLQRSLPITEQQASTVLHAQDYTGTIARIHEIIKNIECL